MAIYSGLEEREQQKDKAKEIFSSILELPSSPSSLATRAKSMLEFLKE